MKISFLIVFLLAFSSAKAGSGRVLGTVDSFKNGVVSGWACQEHVAKSIDIHVYVRGPFGKRGIFVKSVRENKDSEPAVGEACGRKFSRYRYTFGFTSREGTIYNGQLVYVHGIAAIGGVPNDLLSNSGRFRIPFIYIPTPPPRIVIRPRFTSPPSITPPRINFS